MPPRDPQVAETLRVERTCFRSNQARMRYPEYRRRGLMIGSGPAEAACKVVVGQRLRRAGLRWRHDGADHVLALRCRVLNQEYETIRHCAKAA